jgi:hypothetical protein
MNPLILTQDNRGDVAIGVKQPSFFDYLKLVAHTGATLLVPSGAKHVLFSCNTDFFVKYTADTTLTSSLYAASNSQASGVSRGGSTFELNPTLRSVIDATGLGIIAPVAGDLTLTWFG